MRFILWSETVRLCLKRTFLIGLFFFIISIYDFAFPFSIEGEGCGTECIQCHKIEKDEVSEILKDFVEKVVDVKEGPVKGMWMVEVEAKGNTFPVYLHYSKKYFFAGNIIDIKNRKLVGRPTRTAQKPRIIDVAKIPLDDAIIIGSPLAVNKVIVFDDPDCPYCRKLHPVIKDIVSRRKDIAFYIKLFPLIKLHPEAYNKSKAIVCEKSLKLLDDAFSGKVIPPPKCETGQIDENIKLASDLGISGTPTMVLIKSGMVIQGYVKADKLISLIDSFNK